MAAISDHKVTHDWKYLTWEDARSMNDDNANPHPERDSKAAKQYTDPFAWSASYKLYLAILGCVANFSTTYAAGSYTSATTAMANEWHVSQVAVLVGVTVYLVAFAIAPMVVAPFSELNGRRPVMVASGVVFVLGLLFCAVTRLYVGMLLARILVGGACSTFAVVIAGVVADIYSEASDRYFALSLFAAGPMFGTGFGPLISAFVVQNTNWRWVFGIFCIFCTVMVVVIWFTFEETRGPVLLSRKAHQLNKMYDSTQDAQSEKSPRIRWMVKDDEERQSMGQMIAISLKRPIYLLTTEPVVFWFSCWASFAWSLMYGMLIVVHYTFQTVYGFDLQTSSAIFAAMCIATILMTIISNVHNKLVAWVVPKAKLESPEAVLYPVAIEGLFLPIGLFWYGWSAQAHTHWIVPTLGLGCATMGMFSIYLTVFAYLSTAYGQYASSANAAQSMMRNLMAGAFPLFSRVMFERLGFGGACSLLGGVGVLLTLVPWVLILFGSKIRARSKFAFTEKD